MRKKLKIDVEDIRRQPEHHHRPGLGRRAPRPRGNGRRLRRRRALGAGGVGVSMPGERNGWPPGQPTPGCRCDVMGGLATAGAIAAAPLVKR
ncbi:MAG: hypothetical protein R2711_17170 [Acidimicrobiales bacterium]